MNADPMSVAEGFLSLLEQRGVEHLYVGAGTDTAPLVEAYARAPESGLRFPKPVVTGHENLAIGMAHGYYMMSGRPQAVMVHVSVGTANAVCGLMNAARAQVPIFLAAGRTPWLESGAVGARDHTVHWGQEMFDQAGMLRELVKWDYELRDGSNLTEVVDRGLGIAMAAPRGPVYLTLPREVLARPLAAPVALPAPGATSSLHPDPATLNDLARRLEAAEFPIIVCGASGADPETVALLVDIADRFGIAVGESKPRYMNFPTAHPLHLGFDVDAMLSKADALVFLECDVPWLPGTGRPRTDAFVAQAGADPSYCRYPLRSFPADMSIATSVQGLLKALASELDGLGAGRGRERRRLHATGFGAASRAATRARAVADDGRGGPITKIFLSRCLDLVRDDDTVLVNEYPAIREHLGFDRPGTYFLHPNAAGLGWGLPAALGAQQAAPDRLVISVLGDGAYIFCNPSACHHAAAMHSLPVLTVVFDNGGWGAVQQAALMMYPDDHTARCVARHEVAPMSSLQPLPEFERYSQASGGYGERVTERDHLLPALRRAIHVVRQERRQALVHVIGA